MESRIVYQYKGFMVIYTKKDYMGYPTYEMEISEQQTNHLLENYFRSIDWHFIDITKLDLQKLFTDKIDSILTAKQINNCTYETNTRISNEVE